jgi:chemotaxis response regulator CheB
MIPPSFVKFSWPRFPKNTDSASPWQQTPLIAMDKMKKFRADVILLDLEMPRMDGLTFLQKLMSQNPIPVVVCSGLTGPRTEEAIRALEIGAVDLITKPKVGIRDSLPLQDSNSHFAK